MANAMTKAGLCGAWLELRDVGRAALHPYGIPRTDPSHGSHTSATPLIPPAEAAALSAPPT